MIRNGKVTVAVNDEIQEDSEDADCPDSGG